MKCVFVLGNAPELAREEIRAVAEKRGIKAREHLTTPTVSGREMEKIPPDFFALFGGTVKVGEVLAEEVAADEVVNKISFFLASGVHVDFGISLMDGAAGDFNLVTDWSKDIKEQLREKGIKARFVLPGQSKTDLSSVVVAKQKLTEILAIKTGGKYLLARTIWVQDFADWNRRDYGRPAVEAHLGMLPPKVARMMVNVSSEFAVLDPFCGVGTILAEALMVGARAIGADVNKEQVARAGRNLSWLKEAYGLDGAYEIYVADAREISQKLKEQVGAVVTEPDLGPTIVQNSKSKVKNSEQRLEKLYTACLSDWRKILKPGGKVVIALPSWDNSALVKTVVDKACSMGYILLGGPFVYARPQAKVKRNICVFGINSN